MISQEILISSVLKVVGFGPPSFRDDIPEDLHIHTQDEGLWEGKVFFRGKLRYHQAEVEAEALKPEGDNGTDKAGGLWR